MINVNTYVVIENQVFKGVTLGVENLLSDIKNFSQPDVVVETISQAVMSELCDVLDFGQQPVRFTPDLLRKMWQQAQEQASTPLPGPESNES